MKVKFILLEMTQQIKANLLAERRTRRTVAKKK